MGCRTIRYPCHAPRTVPFALVCAGHPGTSFCKNSCRRPSGGASDLPLKVNFLHSRSVLAFIRHLPARPRREAEMAKLNQIIAVEKGVKSKSLQDLTEAHHDGAEAGAARRHLADLPAEGRGGRAAAARVHAGAGQGRGRAARDGGHADPAVRRDRHQGLGELHGPRRRHRRRAGRSLRRRAGRPTCSSWRSSSPTCTPSSRSCRSLDAAESWTHDPSTDWWKTEPVRTHPDEEGAAQPRQGRGDREAPGAGRGVLRGRRPSGTGRP